MFNIPRAAPAEAPLPRLAHIRTDDAPLHTFTVTRAGGAVGAGVGGRGRRPHDPVRPPELGVNWSHPAPFTPSEAGPAPPQGLPTAAVCACAVLRPCSRHTPLSRSRPRRPSRELQPG